MAKETTLKMMGCIVNECYITRLRDDYYENHKLVYVVIN